MVTSNAKPWRCLPSQEKHFISAKGTDSVRVCGGPRHNTDVVGSSMCRANRHRHAVARSLKLSPLFLSRGGTWSATPSMLCFRSEHFLPSLLLLPLSSKMLMLPREWYRVRECLSFYILLPHTSLCMHLGLPSEAYTDLKKGKKKKCCIKIKGFSC